jgi:sigma-B regulation protein RsbU (phosphoserine phosphatase)
MALGIREECVYPNNTARLAPGESILTFSDGVTEAMEQSGQLFGKARLMAALARKCGQHPTDIVAGIVSDVDRFIGVTPVADDVTVLAVRYNGASGNG